MSAGAEVDHPNEESCSQQPRQHHAGWLHPGNEQRLADAEFGQCCGGNDHVPKVNHGDGGVERQVPFDAPSGEGGCKLGGEYRIAQSAETI